MRPQHFTSTGRFPYGRQMGRSLDPLDAKTGYPIEVVGGHVLEVQGPLPHAPRGVDGRKAALAEAKRRASKEAAEQAARDRNKPAGGDVVQEGGAPLLSMSRIASSAPYIIAAVIVLVVVIKMRKG